ncbi:hypothetical protein HOLleu_36448 [Holothuria leucospilota]|uniref:Uncharacterized protein n=1 Tax=Holothuria leucospilota TaxID=206669 RepID=A0A9Q0YRE4_HOLLE|nr:hypothetical protein HOLleu_36448 [Holothuria leucospilota]
MLLLHYCKADEQPLYFRSDKQSRDLPKVYINSMKRCLGSEMCTQILFLHSFTGCDSTPRVYGIGKKLEFEELAKGDPEIQSVESTFTQAVRIKQT